MVVSRGFDSPVCNVTAGRVSDVGHVNTVEAQLDRAKFYLFEILIFAGFFRTKKKLRDGYVKGFPGNVEGPAVYYVPDFPRCP